MILFLNILVFEVSSFVIYVSLSITFVFVMGCIPIEGRSHRHVTTPSVNIFDCNSVNSGGSPSIFEHNPQPTISWLQPDGKFGEIGA